MGRGLRMSGLLMIAIFTHGIATAHATKPKPIKEPTYFSIEDSEDNAFDDSDPVSEDVLKVLLATPEAKLMEDQLRGFDRERLLQLFRAVEVHLSDSADVDYIVAGHSPMSGADCDWFWIVHGRAHPKVILFANGNSIELSKARTLGYRNVRSSWGSAAGYGI